MVKKQLEEEKITSQQLDDINKQLEYDLQEKVNIIHNIKKNCNIYSNNMTY